MVADVVAGHLSPLGGGILALIAMLLRAFGTYERRAVDALLVSDTASALHHVACPPIIPLLLGIAIVAPSDVDGLVDMQPIAFRVEAGEPQTSWEYAMHLRTPRRIGRRFPFVVR